MRLAHISAVVFAHHLCPRSLYVIAIGQGCCPIGQHLRKGKLNMNTHFANLETSLSARAATIEAIHREAAAARATARSRAFGHAFKVIGTGIGAVLTAIATWPTKRDAYKALDQLSDTQLADIGLARGEISRVFEPGFALQAANDGALPTGRAA
jgi:uncharacterized protein YjiS (DUF1127 family)